MSGQEMNNMECQDARRWIQGYLDGELQEEQAAPLRKHLLDCQPCRASAQAEKNLKRWFVEPKSVAVPRDFAARVARRAFAGDRGERFSEPALVGGGAVFSMAAARGTELSAAATRSEQRNLRFVLTLTAAAAAVLLMLAFSIRGLNLPSGANMKADDTRTKTAEEVIRVLDELNHSTMVPVVPVAGAKDAAKTDAAHKAAAKTEAGTTAPNAAPKSTEPKQ
jgi:anti-sigma factor (TIGR02949 family)